MHQVEDIGISPWPMDVVEFGDSVRCVRTQEAGGSKKLYNQAPQTAWVNCSSSWSWGQVAELRANSRQMAWALSDPRLSSPARMQKKCYYGQNNLGSICGSLSPTPTHHSQTTNINPFENKVWEGYFYKELCSFVHWSRHYCCPLKPGMVSPDRVLSMG